MQTDHLNVFQPYENKPLNHEDQLTRAFLILVRAVKLVEATFLELLCSRMEQDGIEVRPAPLSREPGGLESVETQVQSDTKARLATESGRLVSIIITDDKLQTSHRVERTDRIAVYDGFLKFKPDWVLVIENKPDHRNIWAEQLSSAFNENYEVEPTPVVLQWSQIITRLNMLVNNDLLQGAGRLLVDDFLEYVALVFPELNPYDRFSLCRDNDILLKRRCVRIMQQADLGPVEYHRGWHHSIRLKDKPGIKEAALHPYQEEDTAGAWVIALDLHPGDTMSQARVLYASIDATRVRSLEEKGWNISPNFHLAYRSSNLHWAEKRVNTQDYIRYWKACVARGELRQIARNEWQSCLEALERDGIVSSDDVNQIGTSIMPTRIPTLNVCPGLSFRFKWSCEEAIAVDNQGATAFARAVAARVHEVTSLW